MRDLGALKTRYERDALAVRIGGLASNLSRIGWFGNRAADRQEVASLFRESKYFTEWTAPHCSLAQQAILAELQLQLAIWDRSWGSQLSPSAIAAEAQQWSGRLLEVAGLLTR